MVLIPHSMTMSSLYVILKLPVKILDQTKLSTTIKRKIQFAAAEAELFSSRNSLETPIENDRAVWQELGPVSVRAAQNSPGGDHRQ